MQLNNNHRETLAKDGRKEIKTIFERENKNSAKFSAMIYLALSPFPQNPISANPGLIFTCASSEARHKFRFAACFFFYLCRGLQPLDVILDILDSN